MLYAIVAQGYCRTLYERSGERSGFSASVAQDFYQDFCLDFEERSDDPQKSRPQERACRAYFGQDFRF